MFLVFSNHFNVLMLKIIFKKSKNIIGMYFNTKNYLKNNHTVKQALYFQSVIASLRHSTSVFPCFQNRHYLLTK